MCALASRTTAADEASSPPIDPMLSERDPDTGIGYAYVMNRLGFHLWSDPRELALRQALFRDVLGVRPQT